MPDMDRHPTYLKQWRLHRGFTQNQVVDRLVIHDDENLPRTTASLSRIENGKQPYSQPILEALAEIYESEPGELLSRDPRKEGDIIDLMARLKPFQQEQAIAVIEGLLLAEERQSFKAG
jgi:transcriptional regulator with XRE-family HTH domain